MAIKRGLFWKIRLSSGENECFTVCEDHILNSEYTPMNHKNEWSKLPKNITQGKPFDYYPRGRVEIKRSKAIIFLNPVLYADDFIATVINKFGLTEENGITEVSIKADNSYHYHFHEGASEMDGASFLPHKQENHDVILSIEEGVQCIGVEEFFRDETIKQVTLPHSMRVISKRAFAFCSALHHVEFCEGLMRIEKEAFAQCSRLKEIVLPDSLEKLGTDVFAECTSLKCARLPNYIEAIPYGLFYGCGSLTDISLLPCRAIVIEKNAFYNCASIKEIYLPKTLKRIEALAFCNCISLEKVYAPYGLNNIDNSAFSNCANLREIIRY